MEGVAATFRRRTRRAELVSQGLQTFCCVLQGSQFEQLGWQQKYFICITPVISITTYILSLSLQKGAQGQIDGKGKR